MRLFSSFIRCIYSCMFYISPAKFLFTQDSLLSLDFSFLSPLVINLCVSSIFHLHFAVCGVIRLRWFNRKIWEKLRLPSHSKFLFRFWSFFKIFFCAFAMFIRDSVLLCSCFWMSCSWCQQNSYLIVELIKILKEHLELPLNDVSKH